MLCAAAHNTYVPLDNGGLGYTAFVIDAFAGLIAGWECSLPEETAFVQRAVRQAAALRRRQGHPLDGGIHHSDSEYGRAGGPGCPDPHADGHARMLAPGCPRAS